MKLLCPFGAGGDERIGFHGFRVGGLRRAAAAPVATVPGPLRGRVPARPGGKLADVTLNVVEAVERDPPSGEDPVRWVLFTSLRQFRQQTLTCEWPS